MRPIKFRAWCKEDRVMTYQVDTYSRPYNGDHEYWFTADIVEDGKWVKSPLHELCELMQFTGLLDKNGNEIYEGDIIKGDEEGNDVVVYEENKYILEPLGDDCIYWDKCEVIGNVHENPELLK